MRIAEYPIDAQFTDRWSPRGFDPTAKLSNQEVHALFEAARWSPSCVNEQPWIFYTEKDASSRDMFLGFLTEGNQYWAKFASHIIIVCARKTFVQSGKPNPHAWYDAGAAWLSIALEARKLGYFAHCMAGIQHSVIAEKLNIDTGAVDIVTAIAVGKQGDASHLNERHRSQESPNMRKPQSEFVFAV